MKTHVLLQQAGSVLEVKICLSHFGFRGALETDAGFEGAFGQELLVPS